MIKTKICKGDKVVVISGSARGMTDDKGKPLACAVLQVDRIKGLAWVDMPRARAKRGERETPRRGIEQWKTVRYNPQSGEAGGLKIIRRPIHVSNLKVVEQGPRHHADDAAKAAKPAKAEKAPKAEKPAKAEKAAPKAKAKKK